MQTTHTHTHTHTERERERERNKHAPTDCYNHVATVPDGVNTISFGEKKCSSRLHLLRVFDIVVAMSFKKNKTETLFKKTVQKTFVDIANKTAR